MPPEHFCYGSSLYVIDIESLNMSGPALCGWGLPLSDPGSTWYGFYCPWVVVLWLQEELESGCEVHGTCGYNICGFVCWVYRQ